MATSLKLNEETRERSLGHEAGAVEEFLDLEEAHEAFRNEAREALTQYRKDGEHLTLDETVEWMSRWGTEEETKEGIA